MLALRTGWTPEVIGGDAPGGITADFRRACHMALYAEAVAPLLHDASEAAAASTAGVRDPKVLLALTKARIEGEKERRKLRALLDLDAPAEVQ